jgi:hypothetical protein
VLLYAGVTTAGAMTAMSGALTIAMPGAPTIATGGTLAGALTNALSAETGVGSVTGAMIEGSVIRGRTGLAAAVERMAGGETAASTLLPLKRRSSRSSSRRH